MNPRVILVAMFTAALGGCVTTDSIAPPVTPQLIAVSGGAATPALTNGRRIFTGACAECHVVEPVSRYTLPQWHHIVDDMAERTKLDASGRADLLAYITAAKKLPAP